ncbi:MAG: tetratricopeptide repeat protein [Candidatus Kapabacteria bacterium]|nr:tetratricopeptide repeat protein [Candidatus Kapabacteria bacterium]
MKTDDAEPWNQADKGKQLEYIGELRKNDPSKALSLLNTIIVEVDASSTDNLESDMDNARARLLRASILADLRSLDAASLDADFALDVFKRTENSGQIARAMNIQATVQLYSANFEKALTLFTEARRYADESGNDEIRSLVINNVGAAYHNAGNYNAALGYFQESLAIAEACNDRKAMAFGHNVSGAALSRLGRTDEAEEHFRKSFALYESLDDKSGLMRAYSDFAVMQNQRGDYAESMKYHRMSLQLSLELGLTYSQAVNYGNIAVLYYNHKDYTSSIEYLKKALAIHESNNDILGITSCFSNIAILNVELAEYDDALEYALKGMDTAKRSGFKELLALNYRTLSSIYQNQQRYDVALEHIEKSKEVYREVQGEHAVTGLYLQEGIILALLGKNNDAVHVFRKGLANAIDNKQHDLQWNAQLLLAESLLHLDTEDAGSEVRTLYDEITGHFDTSNTIGHTEYEKAADIAAALNKYEEAYTYMKSALAKHNDISAGYHTKQILTLKIERELAAKEKERLMVENERELAQRDAEIYRLRNVELEEKKRVIESQNEELLMKQEQLNTLNSKLRQSLIDLGELTASRKARTVYMIFLFILFVLSEVVVEPVVDFITASVLWGMVLRFGAVLLFRPIEVYVENRMVQRRRSNILSVVSE